MKVSSKKGFSLMEMLIAVAILVILVAVSVPVYTKKIDDVKWLADDANLRSAQQLAMTHYLTGKCSFADTMYYDIAEGFFVSDEPEPYGETEEHSGMVITAKINATGDSIVVQWE